MMIIVKALTVFSLCDPSTDRSSMSCKVPIAPTGSAVAARAVVGCQLTYVNNSFKGLTIKMSTKADGVLSDFEIPGPVVSSLPLACQRHDKYFTSVSFIQIRGLT